MGWSDLPCDVVISIAARLREAGDYLRFRGVCRSWKSAVRGFRPSFFPWLAVIPSNGDPNKDEISFINHVASDRVYKRPLPTLPCSYIPFCSSRISSNKDGWMTFLPEEDGVAIIFNPLTGAQLQPLPSLYTCFRRICGVFLSDNLFAFAAVHRTDDDRRIILVAAAPGDDTWSVVYTSLVPFTFDDILGTVFHEADGKFYAMDRKGVLISFCLTRCNGKTVVDSEVSTLSFLSRRDFRLNCGPHLVSCGSNLLQVGMPLRCNEGFEILKYCHDTDTWIGMTNIGNNSLFVDRYGAKLLPIPQGSEEGRLRRNCVYSIRYGYIPPSPDQQLAKEAREEEEAGYVVHGGPYDGEEEEEMKVIFTACVKIYDVSKGIVGPCFSMDIKPHFQYYPDLTWFMPSLSINN